MNYIPFNKLQEIVDVFGPYGIGLSNNPYEIVLEFGNSNMVNSPLLNQILAPHHISISYQIIKKDDTMGWMYLIKPRAHYEKTVD